MTARALAATGTVVVLAIGLSACGSDSHDAATSPAPRADQVASASSASASSALPADDGPTAIPPVTAVPTATAAHVTSARPMPSRVTSTTTATATIASQGTAQGRGPGGPATGVPTSLATRISIANPGSAPFLSTRINPYYGSRAVFNPGKGEVAWWNRQGFGAPGQSPTSVLAGHVTFDGIPDVFWSLPRTRVGAIVTVFYADGSTSRWRVSDVLSARKESVASMQTPVGARVWGEPGLRLLTCDTTSGHRADGHTISNTVVLADRVG